MKLIYKVDDKPKFAQLIVFAIQQLLAIMTATLVVPVIINQACGTSMDSAAALLGAGVGTLVYIFFTKRKCLVFLGSSFAFISSMIAAFARGPNAGTPMASSACGSLPASLAKAAWWTTWL